MIEKIKLPYWDDESAGEHAMSCVDTIVEKINEIIEELNKHKPRPGPISAGTGPR